MIGEPSCEAEPCASRSDLYERVHVARRDGSVPVLSGLPNRRRRSRSSRRKAGPVDRRVGLPDGDGAGLASTTCRIPTSCSSAGGIITGTLVPHHPIVGWIARAHPTTTWTTSVCTGSLLLGGRRRAERRRGDDALGRVRRPRAPRRESGARARRPPRQDRHRRRRAAPASTWRSRSPPRSPARTTRARRSSCMEYDPAPPFDAGSPPRRRSRDHATRVQASDAWSRRRPRSWRRMLNSRAARASPEALSAGGAAPGVRPGPARRRWDLAEPASPHALRAAARAAWLPATPVLWRFGDERNARNRPARSGFAARVSEIVPSAFSCLRRPRAAPRSRAREERRSRRRDRRACSTRPSLQRRTLVQRKDLERLLELSERGARPQRAVRSRASAPGCRSRLGNPGASTRTRKLRRSPRSRSFTATFVPRHAAGSGALRARRPGRETVARGCRACDHRGGSGGRRTLLHDALQTRSYGSNSFLYSSNALDRSCRRRSRQPARAAAPASMRRWTCGGIDAARPCRCWKRSGHHLRFVVSVTR